MASWRRLVVASFCLVGLTGCSLLPGSSSTPTPGSDAITVWVDDQAKPAVQSAADQFTRDTGTKVVVEAHSTAGIDTEVAAAQRKSKAPDVFLAGGELTGQLAASQAIAPVELGAKAGSYADVALKDVSVGAKIYALPATLDTVALVRNTDLAGQAPATFDALVDSGLALVAQKKAVGVFSAGAPTATRADVYHLYPLQASFGAPVFPVTNDGVYDTTRLGMNNDGGAAFAAYLDSLARKQAYDPGLATQAIDRFTSGQLPYLITGAWDLPAIEKSGVHFAVDPVPAAGKQPATPLVGTTAYFVSAKSKHANAAQHFVVDYLGSTATQGDVAARAGRPPASKDALAKVTDPQLASFGKIAAAGVPTPNTAQWTNLLWSDWSSTEATLLSGKSADPGKDWKAMCDAVAKQLK